MSTTEILLLIGLLVFMVLVGFLIALTLKLLKTLKRFDRVIKNTEVLTKDTALKMECIHPIFRSISNVGEGLEYKSMDYKNKAMIKECLQECAQERTGGDFYGDLFNLAISSAKLWKDFKKK